MVGKSSNRQLSLGGGATPPPCRVPQRESLVPLCRYDGQGQGQLRAPSPDVLSLRVCRPPSPLMSMRTSLPNLPKSAPPSSKSEPRCAVLSQLPLRPSSTECRRTIVDGRAVASFAGWKDHYALYIVSSTLFEAITKDLEGREASKGIIRFKLDEPVPESVVVRLSERNAVAGGIAADVPKKPTKPKAAASPSPKRNTRRRAP